MTSWYVVEPLTVLALLAGLSFLFACGFVAGVLSTKHRYRR